MNNQSCFEGICICNCNDFNSEFVRTIGKETRFDVTLHELCHSNIGWFGDKSLGDHLIREWKLGSKEGVYLLWHKNAYCDTHNLFHMRCLYVGKGNIPLRIIDHWKNKDFSDEMLVYWSFMVMQNRMAKYIEQLLLDLFAFPHNKSEARGSKKLCAYFTQDEVD